MRVVDEDLREKKAGSLRSSLSRARGKLLLARRSRAARAKTLVRRPSLVFEKLSLLKLRKLVNQAQIKARKEQQQQQEQLKRHNLPETASSTDAARKEEEDHVEPSAAAATNQDLAAQPIEGRRCERLKQQEQQLRAPNGTRLVATRLLAPLDDETQLYAIPKKSKVSFRVSSLAECVLRRI